jgi:hypothetical protein
MNKITIFMVAVISLAAMLQLTGCQQNANINSGYSHHLKNVSKIYKNKIHEEKNCSSHLPGCFIFS